MLSSDIACWFFSLQFRFQVATMFAISQFGYCIVVLVAYIYFVFKASCFHPCPVIQFGSNENETCFRNVDEKFGNKTNCNVPCSLKPNIHKHTIICIFPMLIRTRKCTLNIEIEDIKQCSFNQTEATFSFTWRTDFKLPQMLNLSRSSDCAINIMLPNDENCQLKALKNCVDNFTFSMSIEKTDNQIMAVITINNITNDPYGPLIFTVDKAGIKQRQNEKFLKSVAEFNRTCTGKTEKNCSFSTIKKIFNRIIMEGPRTVQLNQIKGSVTVLRNISHSFGMALPSTNNATMEVKDDIWLEIPVKALHVFPVDTADQVNLGVFWFKHNTLFPMTENNSKLLNHRVVAIEVGQDISGLSDSLKVIFLFQNASLENKTLTCVFWDVTNVNAGHWNSSGCVTETKENGTLCSCNHLSFFAVLLGPGNVSAVSFPVASLTSFSVRLLTFLSRVGCGISLCFLCLAVLIHLRRGRSIDSINIHINLCVSLLFLNLTFLINDSLASLGIHWLCVVTAAATHYSLLCTLTWFSLEGFHLYLLIIQVFNIHFHRYLLKLGLVGWGIPGFIVIIIAACGKYGEYIIDLNDGGVVKMCWLTDSALTTVSYSYFVLTCAVNVLCFGTVTVKVVRAHRQTPVQGERNMRGTVLSLLGLAWLLGISWGVLLFQFGPLTETAFYIFCTVNSLHGLFVFLRYWTLTRPDKAPVSMATTAASSTGIYPASINTR